jgi:hypothetical protein
MKNETINDKRALFLDMQEHPEQYTDEQICQLLADEDIKAFAETLSLAKRAMTAHQSTHVDVEAEWRQFASRHTRPQRRWIKVAASVCGIVFLTGVAWAAVVQWGLFPSQHRPSPSTNNPAQVQTTASRALHQDTVATPKDSVDMTPVTFDNAELSQILGQMGTFYHVDVVFHSEQAKHVRLYFKWDKHLDLQRQIDLLNGFERIHLSLDNDRLTID